MSRTAEDIHRMLAPDGALQVRSDDHPHKGIAPQSNWTLAFLRQADAFVTGVLHYVKAVISSKEALEDLVVIENMWRSQKTRFGATTQHMV